MRQKISLAIYPHIRIIGGMGARKLIHSQDSGPGSGSGHWEIRREDSASDLEKILRARSQKNNSHTPSQWAPFCEFCVALNEQNAIMTVGDHGLALLMRIAYEQSKQNALTVDLWNRDLLQMLNLFSANTLKNNRDKCVEMGWLDYESQGNRRAGKYRVKIPKADTN